MAEISVTSVENVRSAAASYEAGWMDRLIDWVDRLPIPYWLFYSGLGVVFTAVILAVHWSNGASQALHPIYLLMGSAIPYVLIATHHLDHLASDMLSKSRPTLRVSQAEYDQLHYRLTTSPAREAWVATVGGILIGVLLFITLPFPLQQQIFQMVDKPLPVFMVHAFTIINFMVASIGSYHTQHQLQAVRAIYKDNTDVNLFNLKPLYAFSVLSARTAFFYAIYPYALLAGVPVLLELDFTRAVLFFSVFMIISVFILPLFGVHQRLEAEKDRLLLENSQRLQRSVNELNERIDNHNYAGITDLKDVVTSIESEHARINRISTWPWKPETLRGLIASVFLPLVIWGLQWVVESLIQPPTP